MAEFQTVAAWRWRRRLRSLAALCLMALLVWIAWDWAAPSDVPISAVPGKATAIDGDSLRVVDASGTAITVRLLGIDAPEYKQMCREPDGTTWTCGRDAHKELAGRIRGQGVDCAIVARDQYDRELARCSTATLPDIGGDMVLSGWALSNASIASASGYPIEEARAEADKKGVWRGTFDQPRDWRDAHRLLGDD